MTTQVVNQALRVSKSSDTYVNEIIGAQQRLGNRKLTAEQKDIKIRQIMADDHGGWKRLGQSMIGPIQLQLRYQGITRNVLLEDALTPGIPIQYEILDQYGQAYFLHGNEGEVRVSPFEGKRMEVRLFRIASFPQIKKEDLYLLRSNIVEFSQDMTKQAIMKAEDQRMLQLLETAALDYRKVDKSADPTTTPAGALPNEITLAGPRLMPDDLYTAVTYTDQRQLSSTRLLVNPQEYRDMYRWEINNTGWAWKDSVVAGQQIVQFGEFQIGQSVIIPRGTAFLTPDPKFLGVFPVMYSLDVEENFQVEQFHRGWVMDELVGMAILNPRGIVIIRKV